MSEPPSILIGMKPTLISEAERIVHDLATELTEPHPGECLACYLDRVLRPAPCNGTLRHAQRYRDAMAPRAVALERRMHERGGCCDCEILWNVYKPKSDEVAACLHVRRGSTAPCGLWDRIRRGW